MTATGVPSAAGATASAAARRAGRDVGRPDHALRLREVGADLVARPDVVAERDDVGAGGEQPVRQLRRQPPPVRGVLAVDDAEVDAELLAQPRQPLLDRAAAGGAEDVGEEEDAQRQRCF